MERMAVSALDDSSAPGWANNPVRVICVVGARPNFVKIDPILRAMDRHTDTFSPLLVHTGQHYDFSMSDVFFRDLELREPDINLGVGSGTHTQQTARIMTALEPVMLDYDPALILVVGDVNSTLAAAITAVKMHIPIAHVESGLRYFDLRVPEEVNRLVTDHLSDYLFAPSADAVENLRREGIPPNRIHFVGNVMVDSLNRCLGRIKESRIFHHLDIERQNYAVFTLHRAENVDDRRVLKGLLSALDQIQEKIAVVWPIHPRTRGNLADFGLESAVDQMKAVTLVPPMGVQRAPNVMSLSSNS